MSRFLVYLPSKTNVKDGDCQYYDCGFQHFYGGRYLQMRTNLIGIMPPSSETPNSLFSESGNGQQAQEDDAPSPKSRD